MLFGAHRVRVMVGRGLAALALGTAMAMAATAANAEPRKLDVDLNHSAVYWMIGHGGFSKVIGQFRKINSVEVTFDPENVSNSKVIASIEAASLDSNHYYRDNYTRSDAFLNARDHKDITFESTEITKTGDNTGKMTGNLTLHGITKPVTFDVTYNKGGKHFRADYMIDGFTARATIKRSEFGMDAFIPWVSDEVEIRIELEGHHGKKAG